MRTDRRTDMTKQIVDFRNFAKAPPFLKSNCYIINSLFPHTVAFVSGFSRDCVQPTFTRTSEHSLGTFREEHLVFLASPSVIIDAVTLTMGRVNAVGSGDRIPVRARFTAPVQTGPGVHSASCTMGTGSFLVVKRPGRGVSSIGTGVGSLFSVWRAWR